MRQLFAPYGSRGGSQERPCQGVVCDRLLTLLTVSNILRYVRSVTDSLDHERIARLFEQRADIDRRLADAFRAATARDLSLDPLKPLNLGSLQQAIVDQLSQAVDMSPREITKNLDRGDEPNVRSTLERLEQRGIVERVPKAPTQRWRLTIHYRNG